VRRPPAATAPDSGPYEYTLARWLVPDGQRVDTDQPICEIESEKATVEIPAHTSGVLRHLMPAGTAFTPGDEIARID
jgi:2-oxoglutarate dehydrogenase E2 component (dihydrolipoamide succinyltransferase)